VASKKVAVVYLARPKTGVSHIKNFIKSYIQYRAGYRHDLIILGKGLAKPQNLFIKINHKFIPIADVGFDIHAYINFANKSNYEYILFCNTYSQIESDDWLFKMMYHAINPKIGIVGCTGSYESLFNSHQIMQKVNWLINIKKIKVNKDFEMRYGFFIDLLRDFEAKNYSLLRRIIRKFFKFIQVQSIDYSPELDLEFSDMWSNAINKGGPLEWLLDFPEFPNPHIRTTAFLIKRSLFSGLNFVIPDSKEACAIFESGYGGLTKKISGLNFEVCVVGSDGLAYSINNWQKSNTFRFKEEENVLISDNHVRSWRETPKSKRSLIDELTWGSKC
jgi:hypothetical protein